MRINEPERPGVTPITLVTGSTTTYFLWIEQPGGPSIKLTLRRNSLGDVFAAIGDKVELCNDYIRGEPF
jgi:hypothetical protein